MTSDALRRFYDTDEPSLTTKQQQSEEIARQTREFLAAGGQIDQLEIAEVPVLERLTRDEHRRKLAEYRYRGAMAANASRKWARGG